jgi:polyhydroxyalkanoate synthesis regulator phasin
MNHLQTVEKYISRCVAEGKFTKEQATLALDNLVNLVNLINVTPKTYRWNRRAKDGIKKLWYRPVAELEKR